jgi:hypothetical protein
MTPTKNSHSIVDYSRIQADNVPERIDRMDPEKLAATFYFVCYNLGNVIWEAADAERQAAFREAADAVIVDAQNKVERRRAMLRRELDAL